MKYSEYLKETQPIFIRILENSLENNKLSHAFLLVGDNTDIPTTFLTQSILCKEDTLACEQCNNCIRVIEHKYPDIIEYDGKEISIKKADIENIQSIFSKSAIEDSARIYILKNVEYSSTEAMNSILKFLEEPMEGVFAIFTTRNINKVLPTIQSRCQVINLLPHSKSVLKQELLFKQVSDENASILSELFSNVDDALEFLNTEEYEDLKLFVLDFIDDYYNRPTNTLINVQIHLMKKYKTKESIRTFLNMLVLAYRDLFHVKHNMNIVYSEHYELLNELPDDTSVIDKIEIILDSIYLIDTNMNLALLIDSMVNRL